MLYIKQSVLVLISILLVIVQGKRYLYYPRKALTKGPTTNYSRKALTNVPTTNYPRKALTNGPTTTSSPLKFDQVRYSPELINHFRDFFKLIPKSTIESLVGKPPILDSELRNAISFLYSSRFKEFREQAERTPEIIILIKYLHLKNVPLDKDRNDFEITAQNSNVSVKKLSSFSNLVREVFTHLPRQEYINLIKQKCKKSEIFSKFYNALRQMRFRAMVGDAMVTQNVKNLISTLNSNSIDAHSLVKIFSKVISWGPTICIFKKLK
ncbi:uncharacterized protein LOC111518362 [Drosophila willistoni]|uniref:uncharacterized protein LOC111518362 n=1 Tax=Drosophila willistoni TaxID=7260 RepID=UPI001F077707|nr:uncharacterized protein LOC111518362 [Drosophila willistoni]